MASGTILCIVAVVWSGSVCDLIFVIMPNNSVRMIVTRARIGLSEHDLPH